MGLTDVVKKVVKTDVSRRLRFKLCCWIGWNQGVRERGAKDAFKGSGLKNWLNGFAVS